MSAQAKLEPHAEFILNAVANGEAPEGTTCMDVYAASISISLKRIADMLEKYGQPPRFIVPDDLEVSA